MPKAKKRSKAHKENHSSKEMEGTMREHSKSMEMHLTKRKRKK